MQDIGWLIKTPGAAAVVGNGARVADAIQHITVGAATVANHALPVASHVALVAVLPPPAMRRSV